LDRCPQIAGCCIYSTVQYIWPFTLSTDFLYLLSITLPRSTCRIVRTLVPWPNKAQIDKCEGMEHQFVQFDAYFLASFRSTCTVIDFWSVKTPQSLCLVIFVSSPETPSWKKEKAAVLVHKKRKICLDREKVHPLHWLSSGYFEKLRAFCTQRTHLGPLPLFGPLPANSRVLTYIDTRCKCTHLAGQTQLF